MQTNNSKFLLNIFIYISLFFVINFYNNITKNQITPITTDNQIFAEIYNDLIDDEIEPFCEGINFQTFNEIKNNNIQNIDIEILDKDKWYENLFNLALENQRAIKLKYKKKFEANITVKYSEDIFCNFSAEVRISGDWNDHIDREKLVSSLDVKLLQGNILGITKFKLFLPETRNQDNEIIVTTILDELGFLTPRTFYVDTTTRSYNGNLISYKYIFQEKPAKEMIEFNGMREAPIYEANESFVWDEVLNKDFGNNGNKNLIIAKPLNDYWGEKNTINLKILINGLEKFNKAIFNSYDSENQLAYEFIGKSNNIFFKYDAANVALLAEHGMTNHNRRFYFNVIENQFYPIYYDGNSNILELGHIRDRKDYLELDNLSKGAKLILSQEKINVNTFYDLLVSKGSSITKKEAEEILWKFYDNLLTISSYSNQNKVFYENFYEITENINYDKDFNFVFYSSDTKVLEICNFNLQNCNLDTINLEEIELLTNTVKVNNKFGYLFGKSKSSFLDTTVTKDQNILSIDNINFQTFGNPELNIDYEKKIVEIILEDESQKIIFFGPGNIIDWKFIISSNLIKKTQFERVDENLLTGCLTFYNLNIKNIEIISNNLFCEDSVNFINVNGYIDNINVKNSSFDAIDADFSHINFENIIIENSGNDCLDLSYGNYNVKNLIVKNCSDKGISIGENSLFNLVNGDSENTYISLAVKDSSEAFIKEFHSKDTELCVASYRKKQEFGPSFIRITNLTCSLDSNNFIQLGSALEIGK